MILAGVFEGGLTAFAADSGAELWRFNPGASIYADPTVDAERGRIYFGAANKQLYALDARGIFLWSFAARDNIGTRPLIAGNSIIFGSEDRTIYSVNADTGRLNWSAPTAAPVASSPAHAGDLAVFGSDDGGVYAINITTGRQKWRFDAAAPVEAPIVYANGKLFACTHQGDVLAIDEDGTEIWRTKVPRSIRSAPLIHGERLWLVEEGGQLSAFDAATGRRISRTVDTDYVGSPVIADGELIVAGRSGDVHWLDAEGAVRQSWRAAEAASPTDGSPALHFGATAGGGAVWLADRRGVIRRLGAGSAGPLTLRGAWMREFAREPFTRHYLNVTPVIHRERVLVVDEGGDVFLLDGTGGNGQRVGSIGQAGRVAIEPTVANDTLLTASKGGLAATSLPQCTPLWKFEGSGNSLHPRRPRSDLAFWMTQQEAASTDNSRPSRGTLFAVDLRTGAARWQKPVTGFIAIGGVVAHEQSIYTSTPAAAFSHTGELRWQFQTEDSAVGGPALNETGEVLFVGSINMSTGGSFLTAIATADGRAVWQAELGASPLSATERAWSAGKFVIVPLWSGEVVALDSGSGAEVWRHKPAFPRFGGITVADGLVWFALQNSRLVALKADSGEIFAQLNLDRDVASISAIAPRPLVTGNRVIAPMGTVLLGAEAPSAEERAETKPR
jgi:outer membrane protein assembly factor BamB